MKPSWDEIDGRFKFLAGDYLGYTLWSDEPHKVATSGGDRWVCDEAQSFANIPDYKSNRLPFLERRP